MLKVITDNKIKDCSQCPLKPTYTRDCGEQIKIRGTSGSVTFGKVPDKDCKVKYGKGI